jgi:hypothetical protein
MKEAITTKYIGPAGRKGSRIQVTYMTYPARVARKYMNVDNSYSVEKNHITFIVMHFMLTGSISGLECSKALNEFGVGVPTQVPDHIRLRVAIAELPKGGYVGVVLP